MLERIGKRIYYLMGEERTDRPCLYYIHGDNKNLVVDAGNSKIEYPDLSEIQVVTADIVLEEDMCLELGGIEARLLMRDSTHSRDALFIHVPEERALIIGDADCEDHYDGGGKHDKKKLEELIAFFQTFDVDYYLVGHDQPQTVEEEKEFLEEALTKLEMTSR
ncbi:MAG: hypothetical protein E7256_02375 [Lachnospiraceae bacterium]|nr:hypothetical protein [Lachnospiraceae bacterium]